MAAISGADLSGILSAVMTAGAGSEAGPSGSSPGPSSNGHPAVTVVPITSAGDASSGRDSNMMAIDGDDLASLLGGGNGAADAIMGGSSGGRDEVASAEPAVQREIERAEREGVAEEKTKGNDEEEKELARVYEAFDFDPLWSRLSEALTRMKGDPNAAQILLPLIEVRPLLLCFLLSYSLSLSH